MSNEIRISLPFKPDGKVLELGGGDIPIRHDANWVTMDMRKLPTVDIVCDLEEKWPVPDASFDGVFGKFIIEHICWRKIPHFASECFRVLEDDGWVMMVGPNTLEQCKVIVRTGRIDIEESAMIFGGQEERGWNEHKAAFSPDYAVKIFKQAGFERVEIQQWPGQIWTGDRTDMIIYAHKASRTPANNPPNVGPVSTPALPPATPKKVPLFQELDDKMTAGLPEASNQKLGVNVGSFTVMTKSTHKTRWVNIDILPLSDYAKQNGFEFIQHDVRQGIPVASNATDCIVASHFLEHITRKEGVTFLKECFRVLKPGGVLRITVPDTAKIAAEYGKSGIKQEFSFNEGVKNAADECEAFWNLLTAGHVTAYDEESMGIAMATAGFPSAAIWNMDPGDSKSPEIKADTEDMYPVLSIYVESIKPRTVSEHAIVGQSFRETIPDSAGRKLRVGLVSTGFFGLPPKGYSGLEMVVWNLACGLAELGHEVSLFAPEGSLTPPGGHLFSIGPPLQGVQVDWLGSEKNAFFNAVNQHYEGLDIVHGHNWFGFEYLLKNNPKNKVCHTHHGGLNGDWWLKSKPPYKLNFIAVSDWMTKVYASQGVTSKFVWNGIDLGQYPYQEKKGDRLLFVGRLDSFKRPHIAIEIAKKMGLGLDIVGGSFVNDIPYMNSVKEACDGNQIKLHLDASQEEKTYLYQNARAVIFPSKMGEPFGLIVPEAGSCGTAVIGSRDGAISETIEEGVTGFVCDTVEQMIEAIKKADTISPLACRQRVEKLFSRQVMAKGYEGLYRKILSGEEW